MADRSIEILVLTDEPFHASYLRTVLQLELPGRFEVRHAAWAGFRGAARADLLLVLAEPGRAGGPRPLDQLSGRADRPPVIVVTSGRLDLESLGRLIHDGADDVIDLAQLNPRGLAAAVLKAVRRRTRDPPLPPAAGRGWSEGSVVAAS